MKPNTPEHESKERLPVDAALERMRMLHAQGYYREALDICLQITRAYPGLANVWNDAAVNCAKLARWQETIDYARTALAHDDGNNFVIYDMLAHGHCELKQWDEARRCGLLALMMRARQFNGEPVIPPPPAGPLPPPPSAPTRERNVIAFSLFGSDSKYCEPAVLNVQEQPQIYPHWVCRFYVDGSVPAHVIGRLRAGGAQIVPVDGPAAQWPGPMWRFLAWDDPLAHRILFRDADSVISRREAAAVEQWVASGKRFHMMRDWGSHTELMLAGLWGVVAGSLPPLEKLMARFMSAPLESRRFADQYFLRQYVWPYARASLMQHDSVFGFMDAVPFPSAKAPDEPNVGYVESAPSATLKRDEPDGSEVTWDLYRIEKDGSGPAHEQWVCAYTNTVRDGAVTVHIPERYLRWMKQGTARMRFRANSATAPAAPPGAVDENEA